jgi:adenylylsulfate kinase
MTRVSPLPGAPGAPSAVTTLASVITDLHPVARHPRGGFVLWFTGLSGAGKTTLSRAVRGALGDARPVEILDGDEVRTYLSKGLGFSREDRDTNVLRIGYVARLLARNGAIAITAAISPYAAARDEVRRLVEADGVPFVEIYVRASLDALAARDVKGLYRKALAGELPHFTGVSDPYEPPARPEVTVATDAGEGVDVTAGRILEALRCRGLVAAPARTPLPIAPLEVNP